MCDSNRIGHRGCIARFGPLRPIQTLSFLYYFLENGKENHPKYKGFFIPAEPLTFLDKKGKTLKKAMNSLQGKKQGVQKKKGKEGQGKDTSSRRQQGNLLAHTADREQKKGSMANGGRGANGIMRSWGWRTYLSPTPSNSEQLEWRHLFYRGAPKSSKNKKNILRTFPLVRNFPLKWEQTS